MNRSIRLFAALVPLFCITSKVEAQAAHWSVLSGLTVGNNDNALHLQAGWPGISATFLHGMSPTVDLGGAFTFNYGAEGLTNAGVIPGIKFQGVGRVKLMDNGKVNLGIKFAPGFFFYFPSGGSTAVGMILPFGLAAGFPVAPQLMLVAGFDLNFGIVFTQGGFVVIPILFGGGLEYEIQRDMLLTFHLRMGPGVVSGGGFSSTGFVLEALMGLAFRL